MHLADSLGGSCGERQDRHVRELLLEHPKLLVVRPASKAHLSVHHYGFIYGEPGVHSVCIMTQIAHATAAAHALSQASSVRA